MIEARTFPPLRRICCALVVLTALVGCETALQGAEKAPPEPGVTAPTRDGPEGAPPGTCWGKTVSPAVIQTVSQQVQVKPAKVNPDGTIAKLPVFRTEQRQQIVTPRRDNWFETPCAEVLTEEFTASLQRALTVRGLYKGPVTGAMTPRTRAAIQRLQKDTGGPDSPVLSLETARRLGLIAVERD